MLFSLQLGKCLLFSIRDVFFVMLALVFPEGKCQSEPELQTSRK